jgi:hypothetical protein
MIVVRSDEVPEEVATYLKELQPSYVAPNEGRFNHGWIIGGTNQISAQVQAELDALLAHKRQPPGQTGRSPKLGRSPDGRPEQQGEHRSSCELQQRSK